ncbi:alginate O-acetyltransferase AlgX-related protein [Methylobacterium gossipiicola]|uniref:SGNH hydrolase-like domain-containing protein, acetyltransferase AlgX n=1 Tax=Methylobacterium gossipiicola TaxID=582675 RepID=A0A1I2QGD0_9HYPH|nr:hypothetical protein [Methylobacterium gossipiicola]SFG26693.1 SGNH hydrolase-like domain-containing protein, acetyltransferase AlgX [Methylobacterium gossipiicola]
MIPRPEERHPSEHPDVHVGRDGWLFLVGGSNAVAAQYDRPGVPRATFWLWRRLLEERARRLAKRGIRYAHVVAPEKLAIHDHGFSGLGLDPARSPALRLERWLRFSPARASLVDLVRPFRARAGDTALYRHTDTHWTFAGGWLAYAEICRHLGVRPRYDFAARRIGSPAVYAGDLGAKFDPERCEVAEPCLFASPARRVHANALITAFEAEGRGRDAHIGAYAVFRNEAPGLDPRCLVLFGDSYAHHTPNGGTGTLTPFFADTFREVHFLWSTSIDWNLIARVRPDFVISEIAERFMVEVPQTGFDIDKLAALALARKGP